MYQHRYARELLARGEAEGKAGDKAEGVLTVLDARGVDVPADARSRIVGCSDLDQLDVWLRRAVSAGTVRDIFD